LPALAKFSGLVFLAFWVDLSGGSFWWIFLVDLSSGSFWWIFLVDLSGGSFWWIFLVDLSGGSFWWIFLVDLAAFVEFTTDGFDGGGGAARSLKLCCLINQVGDDQC
jgi:hypothetical protein